jgi:electron transport complex protein RnfE
MASFAREFTKGLWDEIPPFRFVLGLCPALAVTKSVDGALGMGIALTFVTVGSNVLISLFRKVIPNDVRIACYIVVIAAFVIVVELMMQAYTYALFEKLGIFIPLIVVNCIVLGRAEAFANKNPVLPSIADGLGIGVGYTMALVALASIREILGAGTFWGISVFGPSYKPFTFLLEAPGAFVSLGLMLAVMNIFKK